jgi:acyl carrier protein
MASLDQRIERVFQEVFDDKKLQITDALSPKHVSKWDSLAHIKLILRLEEEFHVKFSLQETTMMSNVGDLKKAVLARRAG